MNFFKGSINEAVSLSKTKNAIFVVFIKDYNESSSKLDKLLNSPQIRSRLESDDFVVVKIGSHEQSYIQFASIYQVVPVPSIFFIGKNGTPIEVVTEIVNSIQELDKKVDNALTLHGKPVSSSKSFIESEKSAAEMQTAESKASLKSNESKVEKPDEVVSSPSSTSTISTPLAQAAPANTDTIASPVVETSAPLEKNASQNIPTPSVPMETNTNTNDSPVLQGKESFFKSDNTEKAPVTTPPPPPQVSPISQTKPTDVVSESAEPKPSTSTSTKMVCEGNVCRIVKNDEPEKPQPPTISVEEKNNEEAKEHMRKILEQKRRERVLEEQKLEKERELKRRADSKAAQNVREWQKDSELQQMKQNIKREKLAEQEARDRIRAQIQADRLERAHKNAMEKSRDAANQSQSQEDLQQQNNEIPAPSSDITRLQFRLPSGEQHVSIFKIAETLGEVRLFVKNELLTNQGVRDFYLATSYPRREFTLEDDVKTLTELGLIPNGVILVIGKESAISPSGIINRSGGIINIFAIVLQVLLTPFRSVFTYMQSMFRKRPADNDNGAPPRRRFVEHFDSMGPSTSRDATNNMANNTTNPPSEGGSVAYRRVGGSNIHRLADSRKDSDDENATWNGNSTQQQ